MSDLKHYINFDIRYWFNKKLGINIYYHPTYQGGTWRMTIWFVHRLDDYPGYEDEWGTNKWKHFNLWPIIKRKGDN